MGNSYNYYYYYKFYNHFLKIMEWGAITITCTIASVTLTWFFHVLKS